MRIYKLLETEEWRAAREAGEFRGSGADLADGYIHFSTAEQVVETARRYFAGRQDITLLTIDTALLPGDLRWEPSRGGTLFPHLYAPLPLTAVVTETALPGDVPIDQAVARTLP